MSLKGAAGENDYHVVVEVNSFREEDGNDKEKQITTTTNPLEMGAGMTKDDNGVGADAKDSFEKGYVEDIEKFRNDSFHVTMTDTDEMHIKHRHPHEKTDNNNNNNNSDNRYNNNNDKSPNTLTGNTSGSHINKGYTMDETYNSCPSNAIEDEYYQHHHHYHHHNDSDQQQPQIFHMDVYSPTSQYRLHHQPKTIEDLEEGIVSPTFVTPPTSPPPPLLMNALSLSSASSTPGVGSKIGREKQHGQMYRPTSFIEDGSGDAAGNTREISDARLDQSIDSVQFQDIFYPNFFTTFYRHFVDGSSDTAKVLFSP